MIFKIFDAIQSNFRFWLVSYFAKHLVDKENRKYDFLGKYEIEIIIPNLYKYKHKKRISLNDAENSKVLLMFKPTNTLNSYILSGLGKGFRDLEYKNQLVSSDFLRHARFDISIYQNGWFDEDITYSTRTLFKYYLYRKCGYFHIEIIKDKLLILKNKLSHKVKPLDVIKSKYEIYQAIFSEPSFLNSSVFNKNELIKILYKNDEFKGVFGRRVIVNAIDLIIQSCIDDGEMKSLDRNSSNSGSHTPTKLKITGKGINYYTTAKEDFKRENENILILRKQTNIQRAVANLTLILAIATTLSLVDKYNDIIELYDKFISWMGF